MRTCGDTETSGGDNRELLFTQELPSWTPFLLSPGDAPSAISRCTSTEANMQTNRAACNTRTQTLLAWPRLIVPKQTTNKAWETKTRVPRWGLQPRSKLSDSLRLKSLHAHTFCTANGWNCFSQSWTSLPDYIEHVDINLTHDKVRYIQPVAAGDLFWDVALHPE